MSRQTDYRSIAPVFDRRYRAHDYSEIERTLRLFLASGGHVDVLDAGCGTGHWLTQLASGERRIAGLDPSAEMLHQARLRGGQLELVRAAAEAVPFASGSFDRVFCLNAFHHFIDKHAFIMEIRRLLRPGGGFMTIGLDPHAGLDRWWVYDYFENTLELDRQRYMPAQAICEMLTTAGFDDCRTGVAQWVWSTVTARHSLERNGLAKTVTSQLAILSDEEYQRGLQRIQEAIIAADESGSELLLRSDLRFYATTAWLR